MAHRAFVTGSLAKRFFAKLAMTKKESFFITLWWPQKGWVSCLLEILTQDFSALWSATFPCKDWSVTGAASAPETGNITNKASKEAKDRADF
tara:strand:- start:2461 stop:2736 length:276 start_codon:yes stop_codon:yes gene_type:complete